MALPSVFSAVRCTWQYRSPCQSHARLMWRKRERERWRIIPFLQWHQCFQPLRVALYLLNHEGIACVTYRCRWWGYLFKNSPRILPGSVCRRRACARSVGSVVRLHASVIGGSHKGEERVWILVHISFILLRCRNLGDTWDEDQKGHQ